MKHAETWLVVLTIPVGLFILLANGKLQGWWDISWLAVLSPLWVTSLLVIGAVIVAAILWGMLWRMFGGGN